MKPCQTFVELIPGLWTKTENQRLEIVYQWNAALGKINWSSNNSSTRLIQGITEWILFLMGLAFTAIPLINLNKWASKPLEAPLWQILTTGLFFLLGIFMVYRTLTLVFNQTQIECTPETIKARSGPLPFLGGSRVQLPLKEIAEVDWQKTGQSARSSPGKVGHGYTASFNVFIKTTSGQKWTLLPTLNDPQYVYALTSVLSDYLKKQR